MEKTKISKLSPEEALSKGTFYALERKLQSARSAQLFADKRLRAVYDELENMGVDPSEFPTEAENATTLEEAISCHVQYGEYTRSGIMREVRKAYLQNMESRKEHIHEPA